MWCIHGAQGKAFLKKDDYAKHYTWQSLAKQREEVGKDEQNMHTGLEEVISLVQLKNLKSGVAGVQREREGKVPEGKVPAEAGNVGSSARQCCLEGLAKDLSSRRVMESH